MKKLLLLLLSFIFIAPAGVVLAQQSQTTISDVRLEELAKKHNVQLSDSEQSAVKKDCNTTKKIVAALQLTTDTAIRKRLLVYGDIQKELEAIERRLTRQGVDASELDLLIGKMQQELDEFNSLSQRHSDTTIDLNSVDCVNKPELFAAGIYELREIRSSLLTLSEEAKETIKNSNQTTFDPMVERLIL